MADVLRPRRPWRHYIFITLCERTQEMRGKVNPTKWLLFVLFLACTAQAEYGGGTGTAKDPYLIYTPEQMNTIGAEPNDWDKHFKLMADIDLSRYRGTDFNVIGDGLLPAFTGVFDGNGHTISNFTYTSTGTACVGIFGYIDGPDVRISNLVLIDPNVDGGTGIGVGSLAGWVEMGIITNCSAADATIAGRMYVGGLVGSNGGSITDCHASGKISGISDVGGLVGGSHGLGAEGGRYSRGNIERCYASGSVTGLGLVGGLVGTNGTAVVTDSYSTCNVIGGNGAGGLVGENNGNVGNCYSYGTIDAEDMVGGLAGENDGIIKASCSSASVQGREKVGGLVGYNFFHGQIGDCYALGDVLGQKYVGGLLGQNALATSRGGGSFYGTVHTCYSAAAVSGDENAGGLVGYDPGGGVHDSFWDVETSGRRASAGGAGKTTAELQTAGTFLEAGWDFVNETENGTEDVWAMPDGGGYPILWWQLSPLPELPTFSGGTGEPNDPYLVATADELSSIGQKPRLMVAHFKLVNDIDLSGVNFSLIASQWYPFRGVFDGNGHTISNFSYAFGGTSYVGLFRYVSGGQIRDLGLIGPNVRVNKGDYHGCMVGYLDAGSIINCYVETGNVSGNNYTGGLVGNNTGVIAHCRATGSVTGYGDYAGGIAGGNKLTVKDCYADCDVDGRDDVGGLVGRNSGIVETSCSRSSVKGRNAIGGLVGRCAPGEILDCYAQGDTMGQWYIGGLVGSNGAGTHNRILGAIHKCYSVTTVLGGSQSGGLLGADWGGEISDCFWDIQASGQTTSYGGTGKTSAEMQIARTFLEAGWDFAGETANGIEDTWWIIEGKDYPRLWWELTDGDRKATDMSACEADFSDAEIMISRRLKQR